MLLMCISLSNSQKFCLSKKVKKIIPKKNHGIGRVGDRHVLKTGERNRMVARIHDLPGHENDIKPIKHIPMKKDERDQTLK